jgi:hypothetical protein
MSPRTLDAPRASRPPSTIGPAPALAPGSRGSRPSPARHPSPLLARLTRPPRTPRPLPDHLRGPGLLEGAGAPDAPGGLPRGAVRGRGFRKRAGPRDGGLPHRGGGPVAPRGTLAGDHRPGTAFDPHLRRARPSTRPAWRWTRRPGGSGSARPSTGRGRPCSSNWGSRIRAGARIPGYGVVADRMSPEVYVEEVVRGLRKDPTLSFQLAQGFQGPRAWPRGTCAPTGPAGGTRRWWSGGPDR